MCSDEVCAGAVAAAAATACCTPHASLIVRLCCASPLDAGEGAALAQLQTFISSVRAADRHRTSGSAYGSSFSNDIAPWVATGCLSPRKMLEDVRRALGGAGASALASADEGEGDADGPLPWVRFELLWRDFFRFMTLKLSKSPHGQQHAQQRPAVAVAAVA
jgi:deoxyribodipyrimidine photolyase